MIDILKEKDSYCLRERLTRETLEIKKMMDTSRYGDEVKVELEPGLTVVTILAKNIPNYLLLKQNFCLVEELLKKCENLSHFAVDNLKSKSLI
jgi:hypothetical protein